MSFDPSPAGAAEVGIPVTVGDYASGSDGARQSLDAMALKMREGRLDPAVYAWARRTLADAGLDGRNGFPIRQQGEALLAALRAQTIYAPDAYGAEVISSAAATLCLREDLCIRGGDCDDLAVALGSALLSLGIPTVIVKQNYGGENQEHVFIAFQDESGKWVYADPSTNAPLGRHPPGAVSEIWVDPMGAVGNVGEITPQIATFGRPMNSSGETRLVNGYWLHERDGVVSAHVDGEWRSTRMRRLPTGVGAASLTTPLATTPGDIIAYRSMWDDFVMGTARALASCAAAWNTAATSGVTPDTSRFAVAPTPSLMQSIGASIQADSDALVTMWNIHAGMQDWEIVVLATDILEDFQNTVKRAIDFYQPNATRDCNGLALPKPPGLELQKQVIGQIEGLGILQHGVLQLFGLAADGTIQTYETLYDKVTNPTNLQIGGIGVAIGVAATVGVIIAIDRLLPGRK